MPPSLDLPRTEPTFGGRSDDRSEKVYAPDLAKQRRAIVIILIIVLACGGFAFGDVGAWIKGAAPLSAGTLTLAISALFFLALCILLITNFRRGLPRLSVTNTRVTIKGLFGTSWAAWDSLAAFTVGTIAVTPVGRKITSASATLIGDKASRSVLRRKKLTISDAFQLPLDALVAELNAVHAKSLGVPPSPGPDLASVEHCFGLATFKAPWLTLGILAVLALAFVGELMLAVDPPGPLLAPSLPTLVALGGLNRYLVMTAGEWYRLFTAPLLHGDLAHILLNGIALLMVGYLLERLVGRMWFFALFIIGALGGGLMSMSVNGEMLISVGASGAIMGLFAAALVCSFRLPIGSKARSKAQIQAFRVLIPSLLPLASGAAAGNVDYGAHLGGALGCALVAIILLKTWPDTMRLPRFPKFAATVTVAGAFLTAASLALGATHYDTYKSRLALIPQSALPRKGHEPLRSDAVAELLARYPNDPRGHYYMGMQLAAAQDLTGAERELRVGLKQASDLRFFMGSDFADPFRAALAAVLYDEHRQQEARETAGSLCQPAPGTTADAKLRKALSDAHICD